MRRVSSMIVHRLRRPSGRLLPYAALLTVLFAHDGCDVAKVVVPLGAGNADWTRLTGASAQDAIYPDWRGDSIVYSGVVSGPARNALIRSDGTGQVDYPDTSRSDLYPRWVSDNLIVFAADLAPSGAPSRNYDLCYMSLSDAKVRRLTDFPGNEVSPAPRPGAPGLAYAEAGTTTLNGRIVLIPDTASVSVRRYLTPDTLKAGEPDWDPTGSRVCFSADGADGTRHIWLVTIGAGDVLTMLTSGPYHDYSPRFSPDGRNIVFTSDRTGRQGVWVTSAAGEASGLRLVSFDDAGQSVYTPAWSPDGHKIVVSSGNLATRTALWILTNTGF